jgi:poly(3-hydroxyalkanoate) synthetase
VVLGFYQKNGLIKGGLKLRGHRVAMSDIECPVLNICSREGL